MNNTKLDIIDIKILNELQKDSNITNLALSKIAGISAPPCLRRVKSLEEKGVIKKYAAELDSKKLGYHFESFIFIELKEQSDKDLHNFQTEIEQYHNISECFLVSGDYDFILKFIARDWNEFNNFMTKQIVCLPNIKTVRTTPIIDMVKKSVSPPLMQP